MTHLSCELERVGSTDLSNNTKLRHKSLIMLHSSCQSEPCLPTAVTDLENPLELGYSASYTPGYSWLSIGNSSYFLNQI